MSHDNPTAAVDLWNYADQIDPGIVAARFSMNAKAERKHRDIAAHWQAFGIRHALIELGYDSDELRASAVEAVGDNA